MVGLPVRTTLLQNNEAALVRKLALDYQSERHCSKTKKTPSTHCLSWITSQNDTAPKQGLGHINTASGWITSQNDTAPKQQRNDDERDCVGLPVRTTLLQNRTCDIHLYRRVGLPVRTTLLQNQDRAFDVQNFVGLPVRTTLLQNGWLPRPVRLLVGLPVRTTLLQNMGNGIHFKFKLDYQSERHCSKTGP